MRDTLPDAAIKHVVVLMLENRGFDHLMGWLYPPTEAGAAPPYALISVDGDERPFIGLSTLTPDQLAALANPPPRTDPPPVPPPPPLQINRGARSPKTPAYNTGEKFQHILNQQWGVALTDDVWLDKAAREAQLAILSHNGAMAPPMTGYVMDYDLDVFHESNVRLGRSDLSEVLDTYLPQQVPVLSGLARAYAVSDEWFCSVPSQTNTNRAFSMTGTSRGLVNNSFYDPPSWNPEIWAFKKAFGGKSHADALPVSTRSMFEVLEEANLSWKVYWQMEWPPRILTAKVKSLPGGIKAEWQYTRTMLPLLLDSQFDDNFVKFDANDPASAFFRDARAGTLPAVSWIEPKWGGGSSWDFPARMVGNDYHPVSDTTVGEDFVQNVYRALRDGPQWDNTLLIITFDENGGTYDHVPPPGSTPQPPPPEGAPPPPPVVAPPGNEACPLPHPPIDRHDMDADTRTQYGFKFDQLGVRVPTLLVSPRIPKGALFRSTKPGVSYDHTSIIASILKLGQIPETNWLLGERVANAPTFEDLIISAPPEGGGAPLNYPERPLSIADGRSANPNALLFNTPYVFEYVGDTFHTQPGPVYLGRSSSGKIPTFYYPTIVANPAQAQTFMFMPTAGENEFARITNMSQVRIATTEPSRLGWVMLTMSQLNGYAYYSGERSPASAWQIRLLGSREREDIVMEDDQIYLVSQLPPLAPQTLVYVTTPDPIQRLLPHPENQGYATTRAGEWALWRIRAAPQQV
jgi:phospholipase C